jgi:hypothetical protein
MSDTTSDPAAIERELDQTRSRLGTHLDQLQDRLSPGQILDDMLAYFKRSEGGAIGGALMENIRTNPMPAALTGIGLAWLMATTPRAARGSSAGLSHYGRDDYDATMTRLRDAEQGVTRLDDDTDATYAERLNAARGQAMGLAQHAQETAESFAQRVRDAMTAAQDAVARTAQNLRDTVGGSASAAGDAIGSYGASAQDALRSAASASSSALSQGRQAGDHFRKTIAESPIALGALGLAAGALLGALLPRAEQEEALLGGAAGQLRKTAAELGRQAVESGQNVARTVADKARKSAGEHGLDGETTTGQLVDSALSGDLVGNAKDVLTDTMRAGHEAARRELGAKSD